MTNPTDNQTATAAPEAPKCVIHVEGGLVQSVYANIAGIDVSIIDIDDLRETHSREARDEYLDNQTSPFNEIGFDVNPDAPEPDFPTE